MNTTLMTRNGMAAMGLGRLLINISVGQRLPRVRDLATDLGFGNGTIQSGLELLESAGAIKTVSRGSLGTFLTHVDRPALWQLAGFGTVSIAMPMPYTLRYEGFATSFQEVLTSNGVPLSLMFMRGSRLRARALVEGRVDLALMSGLAADELNKEFSVTPVIDFGENTYVGGHGLVIMQGRTIDEPSLKIAIDSSSIDQVAMARAVFGDLAERHVVEVSYNQLNAYFRHGLVDATAWNLDELHQHIDATVRTEPLAGIPDGANTHAVLVGASEQTSVPDTVVAALQSNSLLSIVDDVLNARRMPTY